MAALYEKYFRTTESSVTACQTEVKKKPAVYKHLLGYHWLLFQALPYLLDSKYVLDVLTGKSYPQFRQCARIREALSLFLQKFQGTPHRHKDSLTSSVFIFMSEYYVGTDVVGCTAAFKNIC